MRGLVQELPEAGQFLGIDAAVFENIQHQHFVRVLEEAMGQMANFGARRIRTSDQRPVNVGAAILYMAEVALLFEDADGGQHGVIRQRRFPGQGVEHLLDGRWALLPEHVHEPEFRFSQGCRFARGHEPSSSLELLDAVEMKTSTNRLVARESGLVAWGWEFVSGGAEEAVEKAVEDAKSLPRALKRLHIFSCLAARLKSGPLQNLR